ncbi:3191_t:CDS:2, partial [Cetraspora pellucida]
EDACKKTVIREVSGINKCYPITNDAEGDSSKTIATEGVNFHQIWLYDDIIDLDKIYSNDIAAILKNYGVEAARGAIMKEISDVFAAYSINVDPRHLTLVADYMTFEGTFKPFNRMGLASNSSPFLQMSFEATCNFLTHATLNNDIDTLNSPSARLVLGKVVQGGTGIFETQQPPQGQQPSQTQQQQLLSAHSQVDQNQRNGMHIKREQKLLNAYVYDFLKRSGATETAKAYLREGDFQSCVRNDGTANSINGSSSSDNDNTSLPDVDVPVQAPEGFLYEWWTVFWDIYSAKLNRPGTADAHRYVVDQQMRNSRIRMRQMHDSLNQIPAGSFPQLSVTLDANANGDMMSMSPQAANQNQIKANMVQRRIIPGMMNQMQAMPGGNRMLPLQMQQSMIAAQNAMVQAQNTQLP